MYCFTHEYAPQPYIDIYLKASHTLQEDKLFEKKKFAFYVQRTKKSERD